jgi:hypothetical protein
LKGINKSFLLSLMLVTSSQTLANDDFTFGIGAGSLYSGIGVNAAIQSKVDLKYISAGCVSYSPQGAVCGMGIGWIKTDIFDFQTPNHGASVYIGVIGSERDYDGSQPIYGAGAGYHYFFNGIGNSGVNLGFTLVSGNGDYDRLTGAMLQLGYQF